MPIVCQVYIFGKAISYFTEFSLRSRSAELLQSQNLVRTQNILDGPFEYILRSWKII